MERSRSLSSLSFGARMWRMLAPAGRNKSGGTDGRLGRRRASLRSLSSANAGSALCANADDEFLVVMTPQKGENGGLEGESLMMRWRFAIAALSILAPEILDKGRRGKINLGWKIAEDQDSPIRWSLTREGVSFLAPKCCYAMEETTTHFTTGGVRQNVLCRQPR